MSRSMKKTRLMYMSVSDLFTLASFVGYSRCHGALILSALHPHPLQKSVFCGLLHKLDTCHRNSMLRPLGNL